ncbi:hypothetical protein SOVF_118130 [Spinacia oleracea]|uniref:F-box protein CPR1-like isoform X1 n=1 Tax=Spinacia oleracea TaxID=3562 RepID=A0A9R0KDN5_SPIOL|nr:F-box protein CPR1-like isoform X1 [Spinacia oleracea]KNA13289.1 hypothetical protein SOVF_118130 [Spinacia oleracea]
MSALPTEIIAEILSKLPVKSLLRFLCVCKSWKSLIKSPTFVKIHLNQTLICNSDRHLLLSYYSLHSAELDLHHNRLSFSELNHPLNPLKGVRLVGSCNGVLCISDNSFNDIILYNPLTKSHRKLPSNQFPSPKLHMNVFGFGYDGKTDDYKVLKMVQGFEENFNSEAQVYSLNNNSWKSVQCIKGIPFFLYYADCSDVIVNEALHYLVTKEFESWQCTLISSFNLRTESFSLIKSPDYDEKYNSLVLDVAELDGCLCLMVNYNKTSNCVHTLEIFERADLWVMKEYGDEESWMKLCSIRQLESISGCIQLRPVVYSKDGRRILLEINNCKFGWYDLESETVEIFAAHGLPNRPFETSFFMGSLISFEE